LARRESKAGRSAALVLGKLADWNEWRSNAL
jgi:hypothetical protein